MLSSELQSQKHLATLIASAAGLRGIEALQVEAATATGAAALRMAYFAVASGEARLAIALGVEKMSGGGATPALAKALDAETETPAGATLLSQNARLMQIYMEQYGVAVDVFNNFPLNAHYNIMRGPTPMHCSKTWRLMRRRSATRAWWFRRYACSMPRRCAMGRQRSS
jgi:acetyl-CoA C-acetyltransferase